jgi:imidazolonepropionase
LPGAFYCLRERQLPPVAALLRSSVPIAVATDCNPGSSPLTSLLLAANLACNLFGLTPGQSLAGITCHAAQALGLAQECGSLVPGSRADCCLWQVASVPELLFSPGNVPPVQFLVGGEPQLITRRSPT